MHILIIPSWYPFKRNLYSGIFIHEQALAIGAYDLGNQISLSLWGQKAFNLQMRQPLYSMKIFWDYLQSKPYRSQLSKNIEEFYRPCLSWYYQLLGGHLNSIIKTNLNNYHKIVQTYGDVDLIHAHASYPAGQVAYQLSKKLNIPYLITEHMSPYSYSHYKKNGQLLSVVKDALINAEQVITVSPVVDQFLQTNGIPASQVIPNSIDESIFIPGENNSKSNTFTFFCVARITNQKGIPELLQSAKILIKQHPNIKIRIAGHGQYLLNYQKMSQELGLSQTIHWLGALDRKNLIKEYQNCDCFVLPSYSETFGVVYIEAMACGKPVIATRCGGPESFINSTNGILVEKQNINTLTTAMQTMIQQGKTHYHSDKIRKYFLDHFSHQAVIPRIFDLYKTIVK